MPCFGPQHPFHKFGQSGQEICALFPHIGSVADEICIIRSMVTNAINHDPAITYICTGDQLPGKASLGAWLSYGLGTANENLPAFMVMTASWTGRRAADIPSGTGPTWRTGPGTAAR